MFVYRITTLHSLRPFNRSSSHSQTPRTKAATTRWRRVSALQATASHNLRARIRATVPNPRPNSQSVPTATLSLATPLPAITQPSTLPNNNNNSSKRGRPSTMAARRTRMADITQRQCPLAMLLIFNNSSSSFSNRWCHVEVVRQRPGPCLNHPHNNSSNNNQHHSRSPHHNNSSSSSSTMVRRISLWRPVVWTSIECPCRGNNNNNSRLCMVSTWATGLTHRRQYLHVRNSIITHSIITSRFSSSIRATHPAIRGLVGVLVGAT